MPSGNFRQPAPTPLPPLQDAMLTDDDIPFPIPQIPNTTTTTRYKKPPMDLTKEPNTNLTICALSSLDSLLDWPSVELPDNIFPNLVEKVNLSPLDTVLNNKLTIWSILRADKAFPAKTNTIIFDTHHLNQFNTKVEFF